MTKPPRFRDVLIPLLTARRMRQVDLARDAGFAPETLTRLLNTPGQRPQRRNVLAMLTALHRAGPLAEADAVRLLESLNAPATIFAEMVRVDAQRVGQDLASAGASAHWFEAESLVRQLIREMGGPELVATLRGMLAVAQRRPPDPHATAKPARTDPDAGKVFTVVSPPSRVGDRVEQVFVDYERVTPPRGAAAPNKRKGRRSGA